MQAGSTTGAFRAAELSAVPCENDSPGERNATVCDGLLMARGIGPLAETEATMVLLVRPLETPIWDAFALKLVKRRIRFAEGPGGSKGTPGQVREFG